MITLLKIIIIAVLLITVIVGLIWFIKLPKEQKYKKTFEWLKWAVTVSEKSLSSSTGQIRLRCVYNMFISQFFLLPKILSFESFAYLVDMALDWVAVHTQEELEKEAVTK